MLQQLENKFTLCQFSINVDIIIYCMCPSQWLAENIVSGSSSNCIFSLIYFIHTWPSDTKLGRASFCGSLITHIYIYFKFVPIKIFSTQIQIKSCCTSHKYFGLEWELDLRQSGTINTIRTGQTISVFNFCHGIYYQPIKEILTRFNCDIYHIASRLHLTDFISSDAFMSSFSYSNCEELSIMSAVIKAAVITSPVCRQRVLKCENFTLIFSHTSNWCYLLQIVNY